MKCPYCSSENVKSHVVVKDKKARDTKIVLISVAIVSLPSVIVGMITGMNIALSILAALLITFPLFLVLKLILMLIPAKKEVLFVCEDCGKSIKNIEE